MRSWQMGPRMPSRRRCPAAYGSGDGHVSAWQPPPGRPDAETELRTRIEEAGFAGETALHTARRSPDQRRSLDAHIRAWEQDRAAALDRTERTRKETEGLAAPNLDALEQANDDAEKAAREADERVTDLRAFIGNLRAAAKQLADIARKVQMRIMWVARYCRADAQGATSRRSTSISNGPSMRTIS